MKITNIEQKLSHLQGLYERQYQGQHVSQDDFDELKALLYELHELRTDIAFKYREIKL